MDFDCCTIAYATLCIYSANTIPSSQQKRNDAIRQTVKMIRLTDRWRRPINPLLTYHPLPPIQPLGVPSQKDTMSMFGLPQFVVLLGIAKKSLLTWYIACLRLILARMNVFLRQTKPHFGWMINTVIWLPGRPLRQFAQVIRRCIRVLVQWSPK